MTQELQKRVKELEEMVEGLEKDLIHDKLTGLKTRAFFEQEARVYFDVAMKITSGSRREWFGFRRISFIFLDIDHFKNVNDKYGHAVGDEVLKAVAEVLKKSIRGGDTAARWGGEELVVTLIGATERDAKNKAEQIRNRVEALRFEGHPDLKVTLSAGICTAEVGTTFDATIEHADKALYEAKNTGRNKAVAYSQLEKK